MNKTNNYYGNGSSVYEKRPDPLALLNSGELSGQGRQVADDTDAIQQAINEAEKVGLWYCLCLKAPIVSVRQST